MSSGHPVTERGRPRQPRATPSAAGAGLGAARLTGALLGTAAVTAVATAFVPGVLTGPAAMNGSARGTAIVVLLAAVPVTGRGLAQARRGSVLGRAVWLGGLAYLLYNAVMLCFATPFNPLFLGYVTMLALALWALLAAAWDSRATTTGHPYDVRPAALYLGVVVGLNTLAWLARIVPALGDETPGFLEGTGLRTNPVFVQDLAVWLPLMTVAAVLLWRSDPRGLLIGGAGLVFWQLEALSVAVDQWLAHRADPSSPVASWGGVVLFVAVFAVGTVPTWSVLRRLR